MRYTDTNDPEIQVGHGLADEADLWKHRNQPSVKAELANRFRPFATSIALKYTDSKPPDELLETANRALLEAVASFDPDTRIPFMQFATRMIDNELKRRTGAGPDKPDG